jgi:formylglycine-generating enzyme required for sulfatase activity
MNLTNQYISNPKSRETYINSLATYKAIKTTSAKLRLEQSRQTLNLKEKGVFRVGKVKFKMIQCPSGDFKMGFANVLTKIERPFLLGETEVTQELFEKIMGYNPSKFQGYNYPNSNQRPVEMITWYDAVMFCNKLSWKLGKRPYYIISNVQYTGNNLNIKSAKVTINRKANGFRLPYGKEWEYAAKAGTNNQWAGTNDINKVKEVAWFKDNSERQTHPVKCKRPNEWGFYDMTGNVYEWCYDLLKSGSRERGIRGSFWNNDASDSRSAFHPGISSGSRESFLGFRISASLVNGTVETLT